MPYELLTIVVNDANGLKNNIKCCECLRMLTNMLANVTNVLMNDVNVLPMLTLPCHFLTNDANIIMTRLRLV